MLVLSRKIHERILIGDNIEILICRIGPYTVRIGITAPTDQVIRREDSTGEFKGTPDLTTIGKVANDGDTTQRTC